MSTEITTTIRMPKETLIKIKSLAVEKGTTQTKIINDLLNIAINEREKKSKGLKKAEVINHKMPGYNPKYQGSLDNIIGIGEVDKNIDVDKELDNIHFNEELYK